MISGSIEFTHIRHASSILKINNKNILIDPMLSEKESLPPVILTENRYRNPLCNLSLKTESILKNIDYILLSHLHFDHFDKEAIKLTPKAKAILCSKKDSRKLKRMNFSNTFPIKKELKFDGIKIIRHTAIHGKGILKHLLDKGSSYSLSYNGFNIFITGDSILNESLKEKLNFYKPEIIIANAGAAKFIFGKPITMSINEIKEISNNHPKSKIVVVHLNALNHCYENRNYCIEHAQNFPNIYFPDNGEKLTLSNLK